MIKRAILAAYVAAFAFAALPPLAAAFETNNPGDPFLEDGGKSIESTAFTSAGGEAKLTGSVGTVKCKKNKSSGSFIDPETGEISLTFEECTGPFNVKCTSPGSLEGRITFTTVDFHLKTVEHVLEKTPGILITPGVNAHGSHFATFSCPLVGTVELGGNGIVGTITKPAEGVKSNTATITFGATEAGSTTQTHRRVLNDAFEYDLKTRVGSGETKTAALDAESTLTFAGGMEPELHTTLPSRQTRR